jgi:hypothetical protein
MQTSRRIATLALAGAGALAAATGAAVAARPAHTAAAGGLPVKRMESALQIKGAVSSGVLSAEIERDDIGTVQLNGTPIKPSFEVNGELDFQSLGHGRALLNGDIPVKASEINPVIDAITKSGLVFQAEHQHMYDFAPMVWFIHLRGKGGAVSLARRAHAVLKATSTPLPQQPPANPKTPLDAKRLQKILHGYDAEVGSDGVVTVYVARRNRETLAGVRVKPETNIAANVGFEPLSSDGSNAAVIPDFGLTAGEIDPVMRTMRAQGWDIGCLYNQETAEFPQLFFSHQFKTGDPYALAREIRRGLSRANYH